MIMHATIQCEQYWLDMQWLWNSDIPCILHYDVALILMMMYTCIWGWWYTSDDALLCLMMMIVPIHIVTHTMACTKEWCWYDAIYSSVVCWDPKGVAKALPDSAELPSQEEIQELLKCNIPGESGL